MRNDYQCGTCRRGVENWAAGAPPTMCPDCAQRQTFTCAKCGAQFKSPFQCHFCPGCMAGATCKVPARS